MSSLTAQPTPRVLRVYVVLALKKSNHTQSTVNNIIRSAVRLADWF
jgi:hypothetical protein